MLLRKAESSRESQLLILFLFALCLANSTYYYFVFRLAHANTLISDDLCFLADFNRYGFFGSIRNWYMVWQGRFGPHFLINIFVWIYIHFDTLFPMTIFLVAALVLGLYRFVDIIIPNLVFRPWVRVVLNVNIALFLIAACLIFHPDTSTFYWMTVSTMYFGGIAAFLIVLSETIFSKSKVSSYLIIVICSLYAGSSAEHFGLLGVIFLILLFIANKLSVSWKGPFLNNMQKSKLVCAILITGIAFAVMMMAPGNAIRRTVSQPVDLTSAFFQIPENIYKFWLNDFSARIGLGLVVLFPAAFIGFYSRNEYALGLSTPAFSYAGLAFFATFLLLMLIGVTIAIFTFATGQPIYTRAYVHLSFFTILLISVIGFLLGLVIKQEGIRFIAMLSMFAFAAFLTTSWYFIRNNLSPSLAYADALRSRYNKIRHYSTNQIFVADTIFLMALPVNNRSFYLEGEIASKSSDSSRFYRNLCLANAFKISSTVVVK